MMLSFSKIHKLMSAAGVKGRAEQSRTWFLKTLSKMRAGMSHRSLLKDVKLEKRATPRIGRMYMFFYDPKGKESLPYYDRFPIIIMVGPAEGGFYGLNLHYLQPRYRAILFDELMSYMTNKKFNENTRLRLTYDLLQQSRKLRLFKPCFKRYLLDHVRSHLVEVPASEWEIAVFIPSDDFVGANRTKVWQDSREFAFI
jgi:hypothetical protein